MPRQRWKRSREERLMVRRQTSGAVTAVGDVAFDVGADGGPPDAALRATTTFDDALVTRV